MNIERYLRKLATTNYWQLLYKNAKDINIPMFDNKENLSGIQLAFLYWLNLYSQLYENLGMDEFLNEKVIEDPIRLDAYLYLKKVEREKERREIAKEKIKNRLKRPMQNVSHTAFYKKQ